MHEAIDGLRDLASRAGAFASDTLVDGPIRTVCDDDLVAMTDAAAALLRAAEALVAEAAGEIHARSDSPLASERMTTAFGCRNARELLERVTRMSSRRAGEIVKAGAAICGTTSVYGETLPARYPGMRAALATGAVGVDGIVAVTQAIDAATMSHEARAAADAELAASARGDGADGGGTPTADDLRLQAQVWAAYLDPDGAEPRDAAAQRRRGLTLGICRDGLVPIRGRLLPDVAGQLQRVFDSILNPAAAPGVRFAEDEDEDAPLDGRTSPQKNHDAFATAITAAARSGELPTLGGAAPTLLVSVRAEDLTAGHGVGHIDGIDEPVPMSVVRHVGCFGGIYKVTVEKNGRVTQLEVTDRSFTAHQRKVITLRDGECVIPGCHVRAAWCEIHHVIEHAKGGRTNTGNGVLLCWHHHRTLDSSGWRIRMRNGIPEVRGPSWWDASGTWRPVTKSPTRIRDALIARRT